MRAMFAGGFPLFGVQSGFPFAPCASGLCPPCLTFFGSVQSARIQVGLFPSRLPQFDHAAVPVIARSSEDAALFELTFLQVRLLSIWEEPANEESLYHQSTVTLLQPPKLCCNIKNR